MLESVIMDRFFKFLPAGIAAGILLALPLGLIRAASGNAPPRIILRDFVWRLGISGSPGASAGFLESQGYDGIELNLMDDQGGFYFDSPEMKKMRWKAQSDLLTGFVKNWPSDPSKKNTASLSFNLSPLTRLFWNPGRAAVLQVDRPTKGRVLNTVRELAEKNRFDEMTLDPLPQSSQLSAFYWESIANRQKLNVQISPESFDRFIRRAFGDGGSFNCTAHRLITNDSVPYSMDNRTPVLPSIALGDVCFSIGKSTETEVWAGCPSEFAGSARALHNLALYRAAQYAPRGFLFMPARENSYLFDPKAFVLADLKKEIAEFSAAAANSRLKNPTANLVLSLDDPRGREGILPQFIEPVMNALLADGYEVKVSFDQFHKDADLYYVVLGKDPSGGSSFLRELARLLDHRKSRFYGTVIIHPLGEVPNKSAWKKIRRFFKIPSDSRGWLPGLPESVMYNGKKVLWKGNVPGKNFGMTYLNSSRIRQNKGEILLSEMHQGETLALVLKAKKHFLINGNYLHLESSYVLSQMMGGALEEPIPAYVTSDRSRTAILALADSVVKLRIPTPVIGKRWKVSVFDAVGVRIRDEIMEGGPVLETELKPLELLILESR